jgi:hypothetical protein
MHAIYINLYNKGTSIGDLKKSEECPYMGSFTVSSIQLVIMCIEDEAVHIILTER